MNDAKIQLSEDELCMALNEELILTKNRIIQKAYQLFGLLAENYRQYSGDIFFFLPAIQQPKIARGENYNGLPYVMLDYPRHFTHADITCHTNHVLVGKRYEYNTSPNRKV